MIVLAFSTAAMLVVASLTGRALARAREAYSVEFIPVATSRSTSRARPAMRGGNFSAKGSPRWSADDTWLIDLIPNVLARDAVRYNN